MTDYAAVLTVLFPDALWGMTDNDLSTLTWDASNSDSRPTKKQLDAAWPQLQHDRAVAAVQEQRQDRYRAEADPLYFEAARGEDGVTMADWVAKVAQIKADLPYPEAP